MTTADQVFGAVDVRTAQELLEKPQWRILGIGIEGGAIVTLIEHTHGWDILLVEEGPVPDGDLHDPPGPWPDA